MNWYQLCRLLGLLAILAGISMVFSLPWAFPFCGVATEFEQTGFNALIGAIFCSLFVGIALYGAGRGSVGEVILHKEALAVVGLGWMLVGTLSALPYLFAGVQRAPGVPMHLADALFESISGLTTTGASVLTELEDPALLPRCILFWRCFTHWLGGMGIIVLFVAILGHLGATGKALMRREVPGPLNETVRPRVRETAMVMWMIYVFFTTVLTIVFCIEGMSLYDSLCHTFGTLATGGFSTYNKSISSFDSISIEVTIILFMLIAGTNFSLFYLLLKGKSVPPQKGWMAKVQMLTSDPEWRVYLLVIFCSTVALTISLTYQQLYADVWTSIRHSLFIVISIMTTTGFGAEDFSQWGEFAKGLLLLLMFMGGCAGSTSGGIKVVRFMLFFKVLQLEIERSFRPNVVRTIRIGKTPIDAQLRHDTIVYFCLILFIFISSWMILATIEPDTQWLASERAAPSEKLLDCASAVAATLNNIGPGLGVLGPAENFSGFSVQGKLLLTLLMLLGRLELFAILVLFFPAFWRYH